jgi:dTDP-4-amino-4,6-dideoxygalactose transaminase
MLTPFSQDKAATALCRRIEEFFDGGRCFLLAKGRVALYVGLMAQGLPPGGKVLIPGYTCVVVPDAVQHAGLKPLYIDIDPHTYNLDPKLLDRVPAGDLAAVVVQHTYGIPAAMQPIAAWASSHSLPIIEDCCHTFGARAEGRLCGTFGAFAFMSGQWNKFFSTGLGGMLLVHEPALADRVDEIIRAEATSPGRWQNLRLEAQILAYRLLARPGLVPSITKWYRRLNRLGLTVGSSAEWVPGEMPPDYVATLAPCQVRQGLLGLDNIEENIRCRMEWTAWYHRELPLLGFAVSPAIDPGGMPLLRYPLRVANKSETLSLAAKEGVEIGSWFESPLHPAETPRDKFGYRHGMCPLAEGAAATVINLPTHAKVGLREAERTLAFLRRCARPPE